MQGVGGRWMGAEAAMSSHGGGRALSLQGSACSLTFSEVDGVNLDDLLRSGRRTSDEVWRDIQGAAAAAAVPCPRAAQMTLEDFLSRGGGPPAADTADAGSGARGWAQQLYHQPPAPLAQLELGRHHHAAAVGRPVPRPLGAGAGPVLDALYHDGQDGAAAAGGKRAADEGGVAEKCSERRKKRMIKNRESAARSRARKQAYTNELENKIAQLEEENERLRRRQKAPVPVVQYVPRQELKNQLRRANSANF